MSELNAELDYDERKIDQTLLEFLDKFNIKKNDFEKFDAVSKAFMEKAYVLQPIGEGPNGFYDQSPIFRFDQFDCVTYVNTVLALYFAKDPASFKKLFKEISYFSEVPCFEAWTGRFMCVDWNVHNQNQGLVTDITHSFLDPDGKSCVAWANTVIDKPGWFAKRSFEDLKFRNALDFENAKLRLESLRAKAKLFAKQESHLSYLPLEKILDDLGQFYPWFERQLPEMAVVEIVRPDWDMQEKIGTNLNISHVGFLIRKNQKILFRHASQIEKKVVEIPLHTYLHQCSINIPSVKGIHVLRIEEH